MSLASCCACLTRIHVRPVFDEFPQRLDVPVRDGHWVRKLLGKPQRYADFRRANVRIGRDNRTTGVVDSLAHHVLPEKTFLLFKHLFPNTTHHDKPREKGIKVKLKAVVPLLDPEPVINVRALMYFYL